MRGIKPLTFGLGGRCLHHKNSSHYVCDYLNSSNRKNTTINHSFTRIQISWNCALSSPLLSIFIPVCILLLPLDLHLDLAPSLHLCTQLLYLPDTQKCLKLSIVVMVWKLSLFFSVRLCSLANECSHTLLGTIYQKSQFHTVLLSVVAIPTDT